MITRGLASYPLAQDAVPSALAWGGEGLEWIPGVARPRGLVGWLKVVLVGTVDWAGLTSFSLSRSLNLGCDSREGFLGGPSSPFCP